MRYEREADRKARQRRNLKVALGVAGGLTVVSLLLTLFWNAAALTFFIVSGLVFSLLLNGGGRGRFLIGGLFYLCAGREKTSGDKKQANE